MTAQHRDSQLLQLRPEIPSINFQQEMTLEESFQNSTLRPILKMQNDLLIHIFRQYLQDRKVKFQQMKSEKQNEYIQLAVQKDAALRGVIQGCIMGHFTTEEWNTFYTDKKALGKRLTSMAIQRLQSQTSILA